MMPEIQGELNSCDASEANHARAPQEQCTRIVSQVKRNGSTYKKVTDASINVASKLKKAISVLTAKHKRNQSRFKRQKTSNQNKFLKKRMLEDQSNSKTSFKKCRKSYKEHCDLQADDLSGQDIPKLTTKIKLEVDEEASNSDCGTNILVFSSGNEQSRAPNRNVPTKNSPSVSLEVLVMKVKHEFANNPQVIDFIKTTTATSLHVCQDVFHDYIKTEGNLEYYTNPKETMYDDARHFTEVTNNPLIYPSNKKKDNCVDEQVRSDSTVNQGISGSEHVMSYSSLSERNNICVNNKSFGNTCAVSAMKPEVTTSAEASNEVSSTSNINVEDLCKNITDHEMVNTKITVFRCADSLENAQSQITVANRLLDNINGNEMTQNKRAITSIANSSFQNVNGKQQFGHIGNRSVSLECTVENLMLKVETLKIPEHPKEEVVKQTGVNQHETQEIYTKKKAKNLEVTKSSNKSKTGIQNKGNSLISTTTKAISSYPAPTKSCTGDLCFIDSAVPNTAFQETVSEIHVSSLFDNMEENIETAEKNLLDVCSVQSLSDTDGNSVHSASLKRNFNSPTSSFRLKEDANFITTSEECSHFPCSSLKSDLRNNNSNEQKPDRKPCHEEDLDYEYDDDDDDDVISLFTSSSFGSPTKINLSESYPETETLSSNQKNTHAAGDSCRLYEMSNLHEDLIADTEMTLKTHESKNYSSRYSANISADSKEYSEMDRETDNNDNVFSTQTREKALNTSKNIQNVKHCRPIHDTSEIYTGGSLDASSHKVDEDTSSRLPNISPYFRDCCSEYMKKKYCSKNDCHFLHEVPHIQKLNGDLEEVFLCAVELGYTYFIDSTIKCLLTDACLNYRQGMWQIYFQLTDICGLSPTVASETIFAFIAESSYVESSGVHELLHLLLDRNLFKYHVKKMKIFSNFDHNTFPDNLIQKLIDEMISSKNNPVLCRELYSNLLAHIAPTRFKQINSFELRKFISILENIGLNRDAKLLSSSLSETHSASCELQLPHVPEEQDSTQGKPTNFNASNNSCDYIKDTRMLFQNNYSDQNFKVKSSSIVSPPNKNLENMEGINDRNNLHNGGLTHQRSEIHASKTPNEQLIRRSITSRGGIMDLKSNTSGSATLKQDSVHSNLLLQNKVVNSGTNSNCQNQSSAHISNANVQRAEFYDIRVQPWSQSEVGTNVPKRALLRNSFSNKNFQSLRRDLRSGFNEKQQKTTSASNISWKFDHVNSTYKTSFSEHKIINPSPPSKEYSNSHKFYVLSNQPNIPISLSKSKNINSLEHLKHFGTNTLHKNYAVSDIRRCINTIKPVTANIHCVNKVKQNATTLNSVESTCAISKSRIATSVNSVNVRQGSITPRTTSGSNISFDKSIPYKVSEVANPNPVCNRPKDMSDSYYHALPLNVGMESKMAFPSESVGTVYNNTTIQINSSPPFDPVYPNNAKPTYSATKHYQQAQRFSMPKTNSRPESYSLQDRTTLRINSRPECPAMTHRLNSTNSSLPCVEGQKVTEPRSFVSQSENQQDVMHSFTNRTLGTSSGVLKVLKPLKDALKLYKNMKKVYDRTAFMWHIYDILRKNVCNAVIIFSYLVADSFELHIKPERYLEEFLSTVGVNLMLDLVSKQYWKEAYVIFSNMRKAHIDVQLSVVFKKDIFSSCLKILLCTEVCIEVGATEEAVGILEYNRMLTPDVNAWKVRCVRDDIRKWVEICTALLQQMLSGKQLKLAHWFFIVLLKAQGCLSEGIQLHKFVDHLMVKLLSGKYVLEAVELYDYIKPYFHALESSTCRALLITFVSNNYFRRAESLFKSCVATKIYPDVSVKQNKFFVIIYSCFLQEEIYMILYNFLHWLWKNSFWNLCDNYQVAIWIEERNQYCHKDTFPWLLQVDCSLNAILQRLYFVLECSFPALSTHEDRFSTTIHINPLSLAKYLQNEFY